MWPVTRHGERVIDHIKDEWGKLKMDKRWLNIIIGIILFFPFITGCARREVNEVVLNFWHPWGLYQEELEKYVKEEFEAMHPGIKLNISSVPPGLGGDKLLTSIVGGTPPEVALVDGSVMIDWAHRKALRPLNEFLQKSGIKKEDFFLPSWRQNVYEGRVYGLPLNADPNFALFWNKDLFKKANLDPERPPATLKELDEYIEKLNKFNEKGRLERTGMIPWDLYGGSNALYTWGWIFGGKFYDPSTGKLTMNHPKNIEALEWLISWAKRLGIRNIEGFFGQFTGRDGIEPFFMGKKAMVIRFYREIERLSKYAPDINFGVAPIPYPEGGRKNFAWIGGWCIVLPRGSKHPEEAFKFIRWLTATPEGANAIHKATRMLSAYKESPTFEKMKDDPKKRVFLEILKNSDWQRPLVPIQRLMQHELNQAVEFSLLGIKTPKEALDEAQVKLQKELNEIKKRY
ncbi:MAG: sn-glycerol-3-phosphate-binding periplasmic protein UgpB [candidate division WS2 bacterium]|uniref:Sn-glycerol-3-phosphate-binding periplasmic protein UgpB n=1 Tax=Psychracetigena formicireducens TaxID=2986056 RepID=A0A9E2BI24_PSYF1|nr:sn-glycerol-3-phosphate-binding periplasmic protein UgpB [Candidatus Psychracetigena formicireducens]